MRQGWAQSHQSVGSSVVLAPRISSRTIGTQACSSPTQAALTCCSEASPSHSTSHFLLQPRKQRGRRRSALPEQLYRRWTMPSATASLSSCTG